MKKQEAAVQQIFKSLHHYQCFLLQGVTGSGKTEVYLQVIAKVLEQQSKYYVVPEIGLNTAIIRTIHATLWSTIAVLHSHLNDSERQIAGNLQRKSG